MTMELVKIATGEPITRSQLKAEVSVDGVELALPYDLTGVDLSDFGAAVVTPTDPPSVDADEVAERDGVENVGGVWRQKWTVRAMTPDEFAAAKQAKWEQAKANRDTAIDAGCTVPGVGTFDTDLLSRTNIHGAVTAAAIASGQSLPFSVPWKLQDNTIVTLDAPTTIAGGMAVMQRTSDCHAHAQTLGIAIEAAEDFAALDAIDIETGWPE